VPAPASETSGSRNINNSRLGHAGVHIVPVACAETIDLELESGAVPLGVPSKVKLAVAAVHSNNSGAVPLRFRVRSTVLAAVMVIVRQVH